MVTMIATIVMVMIIGKQIAIITMTMEAKATMVTMVARSTSIKKV
jgi:hypothetical protein